MTRSHVKTSLLRRLQGRPFPIQFHQYAKSTHSAKSPQLLKQYSNFDATRFGCKDDIQWVRAVSRLVEVAVGLVVSVALVIMVLC